MTSSDILMQLVTMDIWKSLSTGSGDLHLHSPIALAAFVQAVLGPLIPSLVFAVVHH